MKTTTESKLYLAGGTLALGLPLVPGLISAVFVKLVVVGIGCGWLVLWRKFRRDYA